MIRRPDHDWLCAVSEHQMRAYADATAALRARGAVPQAQQQGAAEVAVPQVVATAPRRIYLDLGFDPAEEDAPFSELHEITWSANNASGHGVEYVRADLAAAPAAVSAPSVPDDVAKDAARYRWLRDSTTDVALVLDKRTGYVPVDDRVPGVGGYYNYEYRSGEELDVAIDAAMLAAAPQAPAGEGSKA